MSPMSPWSLANSTEPRVSPIDVIREQRARIALEAAERAQLRQQDLLEQRSQFNSPDTRIRMWEKVHGLRLPLDPLHSILDVIAADTGLTLEAVQAQQQARSAQHASHAQK